MYTVNDDTVDLLHAAFSSESVGVCEVTVNGKVRWFSVKAFSGGPFFAYLTDNTEPPVIIEIITEVALEDKYTRSPYVTLRLENGEKLKFYSPLEGLETLGRLLWKAKAYIDRLNFLKEKTKAFNELSTLISKEDMTCSKKSEGRDAAPSVEIVEIVEVTPPVEAVDETPLSPKPELKVRKKKRKASPYTPKTAKMVKVSASSTPTSSNQTFSSLS